MFKIQKFISILFLFTGLSSFAQIPKQIFNAFTGEEFNPKDFVSSNRPINERLGVYHFGDSEGEWDLVILRSGDSLIIQIWTGSWATNPITNRETWRRECQTFNKASVRANRIYFGDNTGLFADFTEEGKTAKTLLLFNDMIEGRKFGKDSAEVGYYNSSVETFYNEDRYQLSVAVRPETYFNGKSKSDLRIMRNTIYAKYGLLFQKGGDMEKYFKTKEWYDPFRKDVSDCLTDIEKKNIQTLLRLELMR